MTPLDATYLLPIRSQRQHDPSLTEYLRGIAAMCRVVVVDGSPADVFDAVHDTWGRFATHIRPDPRLACRNGKVHGVLTGLDHVRTAGVVIADDDVRYTPEALHAVIQRLRRADAVCPQNYFDPLPWHAAHDTARILLNRVTGGDFPGTIAVRTTTIRRTGGYDGHVLFENLELMRTVRAAGGRVERAADIFVPRLPPTTRHFLGQRIRQAYDELARPWRMVSACAVAPATALAARRHAWRTIACAAGLAIVAAELGRRRHGGRRVFPARAALLAPAWIAERSVCSWLALVHRARGGMPYAGSRLVVAAHSTRAIRRRIGDRAVSDMADAGTG